MRSSTVLMALFALLFHSVIWAKVQSFAVVGDAGVWNRHAQAVRDSIIKRDVSMLIMPGDNLYEPTPTYHEVWRHWSEKKLTYDVVAIGNHLLSIQEEVDYFKMPSEFYEKIIGDVRFLVLNSNNTKNVDAQIAWLTERLKPENAKLAHFNILVFHHPPASVSAFHRWEEKPDFQKKLRPFLRQKGLIDLVLVGHDHQASFHTFDGLPFVVSGAVWQARPAMAANHTMEDNIVVRTPWVDSGKYYWVRLDADRAQDLLWLNFVNVTGTEDKVTCTISLSKTREPEVRPNCSTSHATSSPKETK